MALRKMAQAYFGKPAKDVTWRRLPAGGHATDPILLFTLWQRIVPLWTTEKNLVLSRMFELNMIDDTEYSTAKQKCDIPTTKKPTMLRLYILFLWLKTSREQIR